MSVQKQFVFESLAADRAQKGANLWFVLLLVNSQIELILKLRTTYRISFDTMIDFRDFKLTYKFLLFIVLVLGLILKTLINMASKIQYKPLILLEVVLLYGHLSILRLLWP